MKYIKMTLDGTTRKGNKIDLPGHILINKT